MQRTMRIILFYDDERQETEVLATTIEEALEVLVDEGWVTIAGILDEVTEHDDILRPVT